MNPLPSPRRVAVPVLVRDGKPCSAGMNMNGAVSASAAAAAAASCMGVAKNINHHDVMGATAGTSPPLQHMQHYPSPCSYSSVPYSSYSTFNGMSNNMQYTGSMAQPWTW